MVLSDLGGLSRYRYVESTRRNHTEVALHIVWTTWKRMPLLADESLERCVWRTVQAEAEKCKCTVLAIGGMPDHVHLVLIQPPTITLAKLLNQIKGVSSSVARENLGSEQFFRWANGYAAFSLSRPHCKEATAYVLRQKEHHADQNLWQHWEWTPPEYTPSTTSPMAEGLPSGACDAR